jgi:hypothetical protein
VVISSTCKMTSFRAAAVATLVLGANCLFSGPSSAAAATPHDRNLAQSTASSTAVQTLPFGAWTGFSVGDTGTTSGVFTFFSRSPVLLRVTDALCRGDEFRVFDRGFALFNTSTVGTDTSCDDEPFVDSPGAAWLDQSYSKGRFLLQPGSHSIKIRITQSPFGGASAFLRIDKRPVS